MATPHGRWRRAGRFRKGLSGGTAMVLPRTPSRDERGDAPLRSASLVTSLALLAGVLGVCGLSLLLLVTVRWEPLYAVDRWVAEGLHQVALEEHRWSQVNRVLTDWVWSPDTMRLLALATVVVLALRGRRRLAAWVAITSLVGLAAQHGIKAWVGRERPTFPDPVDSAHSWAFPSGHVMAATVTCGLLLALYLRSGRGGALSRVAVWTAVVVSVTGVGFTRVYLGVHWVTDVVGGWLFGAAVVAASTALLTRWDGIAHAIPRRDPSD